MARILNNATPVSLVLVDEIGRETSTYDGLALAWRCARELAHRTRSFTLFATHYFELTELPRHADGVANVHLDAVEHGRRIVFMHRVKDGRRTAATASRWRRSPESRTRSSPGRARYWRRWSRRPARAPPSRRPRSSGCSMRPQRRTAPSFGTSSTRIDPDSLSPGSPRRPVPAEVRRTLLSRISCQFTAHVQRVGAPPWERGVPPACRSKAHPCVQAGKMPALPGGCPCSRGMPVPRGCVR